MFADVHTHECINRTGFPLLNGPQLEAGNTILSDGATMPPQPPRSVCEVIRFFGQATGTVPDLVPNVLAGKHSYFLSLTFSDIRPYLHRLDELATGADAFELRVDLLRTREQVEKGVKHGFPPLDYDCIVPLLKNKGATVILASHHDAHGKMSWTGPEPEAVCQVCDSIGDIIKIVGLARMLEDNVALNAFVDKKNATPGAKPFLAINMGVAGQLLRTLNKVFSPITHPLMPFNAAPGQMTFNETQRSLALMGCVPPKRSFLFGNVIYSMSPAVHNTAFELLGMPHHYEVIATDELDERVKAALARPDFGASA
ncbi:aldolase [Peniophora sp. CONT]|nr:aldolase [Peniophora sp. CONT]